MTHPNTSVESELHNLFADERERCSQYKQLYQSLKEEHSKLEDELTLIYQQLKDVTQEKEQVQEKKDKYIKKLEEQLHEKQKEILKLSEEVKSFDPNSIRDAMFNEATNHYEVKIQAIRAEADEMKDKYFKLHHNYFDLKYKFEGQKSEFTHRVERLKLEHLSEIEQLQSKIESIEKNKPSHNDSIAMDLKAAKREVLDLNVKLNGLRAECEELRARNESLTVQLNSSNRIHSKQSADNVNNIRALESEKQKALMQKESLEKEMSKLQNEKSVLNNDFQASRRQILALTCRLEECEHKCQTVKTELEIENNRLRNEYQAERDLLIDEITKTKSDLRSMTAELNNLNQALITKEQELRNMSIKTRQQLLKQTNEFQEEKEKIEKTFQDFINKKDQLISQLSHELQRLHEDLQVCSESKFELEKELISTKEKLEEILKNTDAHTIELLKKQNLEYEQQIQNLKEQINHLKSSSNIYFEEKDKLLNEILLTQKMEAHGDDREVLELKLGWEQQKHQFLQRMQDLESQMRELRSHSTTEKEKLEQKIEQYLRQVNKLKDKLERLKAKNDELKSEKEILVKNVPYEIHMQVKNKLTELQRRLEEYRLIVGAEPYFPGPTKSSTAVSDKLLTDIKNLQLRLPPEDLTQEYEIFKHAKERPTDKSKKTLSHRRKPLKTRNRELPSKAANLSITSSSDLETENL